MALQAVGWLSKSLGLNIAGRSTDDESSTATTVPANSTGVAGQAQQEPENYFGAAQQHRPSAVETYMSQMSSLVFGTAPGQQQESSKSAQASQPSRDVVENCEVDEQGLPKSRNWYYYDKSLGRWNVAPDAPEQIKKEHAERLRQEEEEKSGVKAFPAPPPPPPPMSPFGSIARSPITPQYAMPSYFQTTTDAAHYPPNGNATSSGHPPIAAYPNPATLPLPPGPLPGVFAVTQPPPLPPPPQQPNAA